MCKVTWCNSETEYYNKSQKYVHCPTHIQYKKYASNAFRRPHLMYKVEKVVNTINPKNMSIVQHTFSIKNMLQMPLEDHT